MQKRSLNFRRVKFPRLSGPKALSVRQSAHRSRPNFIGQQRGVPQQGPILIVLAAWRPLGRFVTSSCALTAMPVSPQLCHTGATPASARSGMPHPPARSARGRDAPMLEARGASARSRGRRAWPRAGLRNAAHPARASLPKLSGKRTTDADTRTNMCADLSCADSSCLLKLMMCFIAHRIGVCVCIDLSVSLHNDLLCI